MFVSWMPSRTPRREPDRVPAGRARGRGAQRVVGGIALTRRGAMRGLFVSAVGVALAPVVAASRPPRRFHPGSLSFDEVYRGRHILGTKGGSDGRAAYAGGDWQVTVDGRPLHLMRRADGSYLSMVDHYESYPTPLAAVRAAVDELGPAENLRAMEGMEGMDGMDGMAHGARRTGRGKNGAEGNGHHHGVHA
jgi:hypothetical protein